MQSQLLAIGAGAGVLALLYAFFLTNKISKMDAGTDKMKEIAAAIHEGAMAFLFREYKTLVFFVVGVAAFITIVGFITPGADSLQPATAVSFIIGAICSVSAGYIGMNVATKSNVRTANAARSDANTALNVAFSGGAVMGMSVVGLGLIGLGIVSLIFDNPNIINGFALGASSIALFARVGGGIYTKAADVGADLVGKVEAGIPEDDPRNPAVIADNVGDNVGDVAGMGADLFESYVGSIIAAMALAASSNLGEGALILPFMIAASGIIASIIGSFFVKSNDASKAARALNTGETIAAVISFVAIFFLCRTFLKDSNGVTAMGAFIACVVGLIAGVLIGKITEYYTSADFGPVKEIARSSQTGTATNIISGLAQGMMSTALPVIAVVIAIILSYRYAGNNRQSC